MLCGRYLPFHSSQHMRDFHQMIVDDIREMIGGIAVRFDDDCVAFMRWNIVQQFTVNQVVVVVNIWVQFKSERWQCNDGG